MPTHHHPRQSSTIMPSGFYAPASSSQAASAPCNKPPPPPPPGSAMQQPQFLYNYSNAKVSSSSYRRPHTSPYVRSSASSTEAYQYHHHHHQQQQQQQQYPRKRVRRDAPSADEHHLRHQSLSSWRCEACNLNFDSNAALQSHVASHITCTARGCTFAAAPKVVKAHYQKVHGKFATSGGSGSGFKTVAIAVPGCPVRRFKICVGNRPEDVQKWIAERRKRFPRQSSSRNSNNKVQKEREMDKEPKQAAVCQEQKGLTSLLEGYGSSSSSSSDEEEEKEKTKKTSASAIDSSSLQEKHDANGQPRRAAKSRPCRYFMRNGTCRNGDSCTFSHDIDVMSSKAQRQKNHARRNNNNNNRNNKKPSLLEKLLRNDVRRETILTLQLLEHIVDTDYFLAAAQQKPKEI